MICKAKPAWFIYDTNGAEYGVILLYRNNYTPHPYTLAYLTTVSAPSQKASQGEQSGQTKHPFV